MAWRILSIGSRVTWGRIGRCLIVENAPFTDDESWIDIALSSELRTALKPGELQARLTIAEDDDARLALWVDRVRMRGREYESLHAFAMREGAGWVSYIPQQVKRAFDDHIETYAPPRQSGFRLSERPRRNAVIMGLASGGKPRR